MRFLILAAVVVAALAVPAPVDHEHINKEADATFLERQKQVLGLFNHIYQKSHYKTHVEIAEQYNPEQNVAGYADPKYVHEFFYFYHSNILERNEIFTVFNDVHVKQAMSLFKMFYHAKDWDTFYKTAVWARQHVNQGMFVYAFSVAVVHRPDSYGIIIPPIYEVFPHLFFNDEVIAKAQIFKQQYHPEHKAEYKFPYVIEANYSGHYLNLHPEQSMGYYLEDVGINAFYYYYNIFYPFWMKGQEYGMESHHRGELFYYVHQQLLARYFLERLSDNWGDIPYFNWEEPMETGFYPSLSYPTGLHFPERPNFAKFPESVANYQQSWSFKQPYALGYQGVKGFERRLIDSIRLGYVLNDHGEKVDLYTEEGMNILGNMVEGNADSVHYRYYGGYWDEAGEYRGGYVHYARHLLGYARQPMCYHQTQPSALEHFETSMRDPAFYQFYKKVVYMFQLYKSYLPPYSQKDLYFDGVKVTNVEIDRLITYFDHFEADITNAVFVNEHEFEDHDFRIHARQHRLTHKPYTYKLHVHADKDTKASVRVYVGPKYDEYGRPIHLNENRVNYVQLDQFEYDLKTGDNVITRNSYDNHFYHNDRTTYKQLYLNVVDAAAGNRKFYVGGEHGDEFFFGFPHRYMLPKGSYEGVEYDFVFVVSPVKEYHHEQTENHSGHAVHYDGYPLGYPFDRRLVEYHFYHATNIYSHGAKVYHRKFEDINSTEHQ